MGRISSNWYHIHGICSYDPCNRRRSRLLSLFFNLLLQADVESDSKKKTALELALQANEELHKQRAETEAGILRAHGHT
jgi:hypothetical protein